MTNLLEKGDWPKYTKTKPKKYSVEQINRMLSVADKEEAFTIEFFIYSGFRDGEVQHAQYTDITYHANKITVHEKPHLNWKPKDGGERTIRLPADFVKRIAERRKAAKSNLIFPNGKGRPNKHLIRILKRVVKRADLEIVGRVDDHRFRKTFASMYSKKFAPQTIQQLLGHSSLQTTMLYLAADDMESKQAIEAVEEVFADVGAAEQHESPLTEVAAD